MSESDLRLSTALPPDDLQRRELHDEIHARPTPRIRLPALVVSIAVLNDGVARAQEAAHLRQLPGLSSLRDEDLGANYLHLRPGGISLKWERHTEFSRYVLVQTLPAASLLGASEPELLSSLAVPPQWLRAIPGRTIAAVKLAMVEADIGDPQAALVLAQRWLGSRTVVASLLGNGHSIAVSNFRLQASGFERMLLLAPPGTTATRAGRAAQRLLEFETYRMMALRGLPVAKALLPMVAEIETALAEVTARLESRSASESDLLDALIHEAARVERAMAEHQYRFAATAAYDALVRQRLGELREQAIAGTQTLGEFMQRRLSPAIATVASTAQRLASLSQRIERASALLRTRVDIATEARNQELLAKLTRGQELQLNLQTTVEGLSIAAISYYVISLLQYGAKALKAAGVPIQPEIAAGVLVVPVMFVVWKATQRIHARFAGAH